MASKPIPKASTEAKEQIKKYYPTAELPSPEDCQGCPKYPSSLDIESTEPLFETAPRDAAHILVATGETNWEHNISNGEEIWAQAIRYMESEKDTYEELAGGPVRINGTDLDIEDIPEGKVRIIVMPQFLTVVATPDEAVEHVKKILAIKNTSEAGDLGPIVPWHDKGIILVCSHAQRDKRCGVTAPILRKQLEIELRHADLYRSFDDDTPGGVRVMFVNHVGGHKFSANCFVYQNNGEAIMMARVQPLHARLIVEETVQKGVVFPDLVRNCNKLASYVW